MRPALLLSYTLQVQIYTAPYLFSSINGHQVVDSRVDRGQQEVVRRQLRLYSVVYLNYRDVHCVILIRIFG
jgi:hypothetical protein